MSENLVLQLNFLSSALFSSVLVVGLGNTLLGLLGVRELKLGLPALGVAGVLGLGVLALFLNFFLPLGGWFFFGLVFLSVFGHWQMIRGRGFVKVQRDYLILFLVVAVFWTIGLRRPVQSDTGLYHIPLIQHMHVSSLPFGFAHVHSRFGTWNFWFSVCGGMSAGGFLKLSEYCMNMVLFGFLGLDLSRFLGNREDKAHFFALSLLLYFSVFDLWLLGGGQKSPDADYAGAFVAVWGLCHFIRRDGDSGSRLMVVLLSGLGILLKLNQLPLLALVFFLALNRKARGERNLRRVSGFLGFAFSMMLLRSVWTTGCILFPLEGTRLPLEWSLERESIKEFHSVVIRWARWWDGPVDKVVHGFGWVAHWWRGFFSQTLTVAASFSLFLHLLLKSLMPKRVPSMDGSAVLAMLLGLGFWFLTAPDFRFGMGYFIGILGLSCEPVLRFAFESSDFFSRHKPNFIRLGLILVLVFMVGQIRKADDWGAATLKEPEINYEVKRNWAGQMVRVPSPESNQCWRISQPCTPEFNAAVIRTDFWIWSVFTLEHLKK